MGMFQLNSKEKVLFSKKTPFISKKFENEVLSEIYSLLYEMEKFSNNLTSKLARIIQFSKPTVGIPSEYVKSKNEVIIFGENCNIDDKSKNNSQFIRLSDVESYYTDSFWKENDSVYLKVHNKNNDISLSLMTDELSKGTFVQKDKSEICSNLLITNRQPLSNNLIDIDRTECLSHFDTKRYFYLNSDTIDLSKHKTFSSQFFILSETKIEAKEKAIIDRVIHTSKSEIKSHPTLETAINYGISKTNPALSNLANMSKLKTTNMIQLSLISNEFEDYFKKTDEIINPTKEPTIPREILSEDIDRILNGNSMCEGISKTEFATKKELSEMLEKLFEELNNIGECQ